MKKLYLLGFALSIGLSGLSKEYEFRWGSAPNIEDLAINAESLIQATEEYLPWYAHLYLGTVIIPNMAHELAHVSRTEEADQSYELEFGPFNSKTKIYPAEMLHETKLMFYGAGFEVEQLMQDQAKHDIYNNGWNLANIIPIIRYKLQLIRHRRKWSGMDYDHYFKELNSDSQKRRFDYMLLNQLLDPIFYTIFTDKIPPIRYNLKSHLSDRGVENYHGISHIFQFDKRGERQAVGLYYRDGRSKGYGGSYSHGWLQVGFDQWQHGKSRFAGFIKGQINFDDAGAFVIKLSHKRRGALIGAPYKGGFYYTAGYKGEF